MKKLKEASGSQDVDRGISDLQTERGKRNANKLPPLLLTKFTKEELKSLSDLLFAAIIDGRIKDVWYFFETEHKADALLKLIKDE